MSITIETAKAHANDFAVCCCRFEAGTVIEPSNLEDPAIFDDLQDSGLLVIPNNCLTIGEVLGAKLTKTLDALSPITSDVLEGLVAKEVVKENKEEVVSPVAKVAQVSAVSPVGTVGGQTIKIHIGEGRDINLEIPLSVATQMGVVQVPTVESSQVVSEAKEETVTPTQEAKLVRTLTKKHFKIEKVEFGEETKIEGTTLYIRTPDNLAKEAVDSQELVVDLKLEIITPDKYNTYSETIMDIQPIATKEDGELGTGITRILDGVIMMVTGTDEDGVQIGEFGSSEGELETNIMWGRPGCPEKGEIFIKTEVTIKAGTNMERPG
ncbi:MAG: D-proline reductase (dithiol) proprotein PrdA, partial [Romboutsia sp.]